MKQVFVLPHPDGWAVVCYGDEVIPDDEIIPLPLTSECSYDEACQFVANLELGQDAMIDGWETMAQLCELEPALYEQVAK